MSLIADLVFPFRSCASPAFSSDVSRAFRCCASFPDGPAAEASRPLASGRFAGITSRAFIPRASCVLASGRLSGVEPGMMSRTLRPARIWKAHAFSHPEPHAPHIRKAHVLSHLEPHTPVAPSSLMRSQEEPHALLTKTAAGCGRILRNTHSLRLLRSTSIQ